MHVPLCWWCHIAWGLSPRCVSLSVSCCWVWRCFELFLVRCVIKGHEKSLSLSFSLSEKYYRAFLKEDPTFQRNASLTNRLLKGALWHFLLNKKKVRFTFTFTHQNSLCVSLWFTKCWIHFPPHKTDFFKVF